MTKDCDEKSSPSEEKIKKPKSHTPRKLKNSKISKKKVDNDEKVETKLENCLQVLKINNQLEQAAAKNNLTAANVRNILKRVVRNEHVLAIVKLKESEIAEEKCEEDNANDLLNNFTPLTRSKVKELQQKDLPVAWPIPVVSPVQPSTSEVAVLINQELPDDSSDEEYNPYDENISDDETESVATTSDIESIPNVSENVPNDPEVDISKTNWTEDGLFKIPQISSSEDQTIALRTRSKLSLSSTHIETIEKAFIPPDITSDMYDCDDVDGVWKDFLHEFTEPLPQHQEDDEETDPEYNVQIDEIPVDKEELREDQEVTVSKRELSDLVAELLDMNSFGDIETFCNTVDNSNQNAIECQYVTDQHILPENGSPQNISPENVSNAELSHTTLLNKESESNDDCPKITIETGDDLNVTDCVMTAKQKLILDQQLRQHVQLCTQHFLQLYGHPELWSLAETCKQNLNQLLSRAGSTEHHSVHNLKPALELCELWEKRLSQDNIETRSIFQFITKQISISRANKLSHNRYYSKFPPQMMDVVCDSKVFIYPELLPKIPFRLDLSNGGLKEFTLDEQHVIAIELHQYYQYMKNNPQLYKKNCRGNYSLMGACQLIEDYFKCGRTAKTLYRQIRNRLVKSKKDNPIKYFFKHNKPPPTEHVLIPFDPNLILPPRKQSIDQLHYTWRTHILKPTVEVKRKDCPRFVVNPIILSMPCLNDSNPTYKIEINHLFSDDNTIATSELSVTNNSTSNNNSTSVCDDSIAPSSCSMPIIFSSPPKKAASKQVPTTPQLVTYISTPINNLIFTSSQHSADNTTRNYNTQRNLSFNIKDQISPILNEDKAESLNCTCKDIVSEDKSNGMQKLVTEYFTPSRRDMMNESNKMKNTPLQVTYKLREYIQSYFDSVLNNLYLIYNVTHKTKCIKKSFIHIFTLDYFLSIFFPKMLPLMSNSLTLQNRRCSPFTNSDNTTDTMSESDSNTCITSKQETLHNNNDSKKMERHYTSSQLEKSNEKSLQNSFDSEMLREFNTESNIHKVNIYYERVKNCLKKEGSDILDRFHEIVMSISTSEKPSLFYKKLELLFLPSYPNLLRHFLAILLPQKAERMLKFMNVFLNTDINKFIDIVKCYLSDHSVQLKKVYIALSELSEIPDVSLCDVISAVLPLVKGNIVLKKWFLQLFPYEILSESDVIDHAHIDVPKTSTVDSHKPATWTENEVAYGGLKCICKCHVSDDENYRKRNAHCIPCAMKYVQDRICCEAENAQLTNNYVAYLSSPESKTNKSLSSNLRHVFGTKENQHVFDNSCSKYNLSTPNKRMKLDESSGNSTKNKSANRCHEIKLRKKSFRSTMAQIQSTSNVMRQRKVRDYSVETDSSSHKLRSNDNLYTKDSYCKHESSSESLYPDVSLSSNDSCEIYTNNDTDKRIIETIGSRKSKLKVTQIYSRSNTEKESNINKNCGINLNKQDLDCNHWTREEDKIVLQALQKQISYDQTCKLLPHKKLSDIKNRSQVLLKILNNLSQET